MTDDINKSNEAFSLEPDAIFSYMEQYNPPALHLYQNRKIILFSASSKPAWLIYLYETVAHSWQPGITASLLHSSKICLIGFHHKASQLHGPRRPERTAKWKNKGRIRGAVSFWVIWLLPQERVGWISHTAIWRISTHCVYCIQWLTPGNMGQICEEVEQAEKEKQRDC